MRITVFGAAGNVGRRVVAEASSRGHRVTAVTRRPPGTGGATVVDTPDFPPDWRPIALACARQLDVCRADTGADWTYLSPPALLEPGRRTGGYRTGTDELLVDAAGDSAISMEDFAVAPLDEAERPRHRRTRFTVGY
ncbi:hypothetical protein Misp01_23170 [Microtetraspora sp. NBRC 13810]|uniref:NAD(P)-dependent oxidoreductase n=1 Tax=Microtetraspora sp. NBRC 13810 TaxID=3030990 RepID=UPI0024A4A589|nr:NmrA family NAD(P)-binding protein [Microtetraspora sp. NBRC 13810]GLW07187.1 hypothetical protein Misp01_23170 [Microtetraspora sp. NBRC 13810]